MLSSHLILWSGYGHKTEQNSQVRGHHILFNHLSFLLRWHSGTVYSPSSLDYEEPACQAVTLAWDVANTMLHKTWGRHRRKGEETIGLVRSTPSLESHSPAGYGQPPVDTHNAIFVIRVYICNTGTILPSRSVFFFHTDHMIYQKTG